MILLGELGDINVYTGPTISSHTGHPDSATSESGMDSTLRNSTSTFLEATHSETDSGRLGRGNSLIFELCALSE